MDNEKLAHELALAFAFASMNRDTALFNHGSDYIGAATVLTQEYLNIYSEILGILEIKRSS